MEIFPICRRTFLLGSAVVFVSCASQEPVPEVVAAAAAVGESSAGPVEFRSKPVEMPPRNEIKGKYTGIDLEEFFVLQQSGNVLIYDVRLPYFYQKDHIPGAVNWPHNSYEAQVQSRDIEIQKALTSGKKVVLYCFNVMCPEARNVAKKLKYRDYEIYVFSKGIDAWREAGLPLGKPEEKAGDDSE